MSLFFLLPSQTFVYEQSVFYLVVGIGVWKSQTFKGYVAVRQERGSIVPLLILGIGLMICIEHIRYLLPLFKNKLYHQHCDGKRVQDHTREGFINAYELPLVMAWLICSFYSVYRSTSWLFMYVNQWWTNILVTQTLLWGTDVLAYVLLFSGALQNKHPTATNRICFAIKVYHIIFSVYEVLRSSLSLPTGFSWNYLGHKLFIDDHFRNICFLAEDLLFSWLFLYHHRKSKLNTLICVFGLFAVHIVLANLTGQCLTDAWCQHK